MDLEQFRVDKKSDDHVARYLDADLQKDIATVQGLILFRQGQDSSTQEVEVSKAQLLEHMHSLYGVLSVDVIDFPVVRELAKLTYYDWQLEGEPKSHTTTFITFLNDAKMLMPVYLAGLGEGNVDIVAAALAKCYRLLQADGPGSYEAIMKTFAKMQAECHWKFSDFFYMLEVIEILAGSEDSALRQELFIKILAARKKENFDESATWLKYSTDDITKIISLYNRVPAEWREHLKNFERKESTPKTVVLASRMRDFTANSKDLLGLLEVIDALHFSKKLIKRFFRFFFVPKIYDGFDVSSDIRRERVDINRDRFQSIISKLNSCVVSDDINKEVKEMLVWGALIASSRFFFNNARKGEVEYENLFKLAKSFSASQRGVDQSIWRKFRTLMSKPVTVGGQQGYDFSVDDEILAYVFLGALVSLAWRGSDENKILRAICSSTSNLLPKSTGVIWQRVRPLMNDLLLERLQFTTAGNTPKLSLTDSNHIHMVTVDGDKKFEGKSLQDYCEVLYGLNVLYSMWRSSNDNMYGDHSEGIKLLQDRIYKTVNFCTQQIFQQCSESGNWMDLKYWLELIANDCSLAVTTENMASKEAFSSIVTAFRIFLTDENEMEVNTSHNFN